MINAAQNQPQPLPEHMPGENASTVDPAIQSGLLAQQVVLLTSQVAMALVEQMVFVNLLAQEVISHSQDSIVRPSNSTPPKEKEVQQNERSFSAQKTFNEKQYTFTTKSSLKGPLKESHKFVPNQKTTQETKQTSKILTLTQPTSTQFQSMPKSVEKSPLPSSLPSSQTSQPKKEQATHKADTPHSRSNLPSSQPKQTASKSSSPTTSQSLKGREQQHSSPASLKSQASTHSEESQSWWEKQEQKEGGQQHKQQQEEDENPQQQEEEIQKIDETSATTPTNSAPSQDQPSVNSAMRKIIEYGNQESTLSQQLPMRVSQFDVLLLFIEVLKLSIKSRREERISRLQERALQLQHMEKVVSSYKSQGKHLLIAGIGSGVLGIAAGALPIIGHMKGESILNSLSQSFSSLRGINQRDFFKNLSRMTHTMSQFQKSYGDIHSSFAQGHRHFDEKWGDWHRAEEEQDKRNIDEIIEAWKGVEQFLHQALQMNHDAVRQLYGQ